MADLLSQAKPQLIYACLVSLQKISTHVRHSIWLAHKQKCAYCGEPLRFSETEIDHVVPESLLRQRPQLAAILAGLGLPETFDLSAVENLVPAHGRCNRKKAAIIFNPQSAVLLLAVAGRCAEMVRELVSAKHQEESRESVLTTLSIALKSGVIMLTDVLQPQEPELISLSQPLTFADGVETSITSSQVEEFLDRPVLMGGGPEIVAHFGDDSGTRMTVRTCREYRAALASNFYAQSNYDNKSEAFLKSANAVLTAAEVVRRPTVSYLSRPYKGVADLALMPAMILPSLTMNAEEREAFFSDQTIQDFVDDGRVRVLRVSTHELRLEWDFTGLLVRELCRADLDGDGVEDMLCECYEWATGGTYGHGWTCMISRRSNDEVFTVTRT